MILMEKRCQIQTGPETKVVWYSILIGKIIEANWPLLYVAVKICEELLIELFNGLALTQVLVIHFT